MTGDGLFHIDPEGALVSMTVTPYAAEDILQALLETHPDLLAGGQMTPDSPRRWLLVKREQGVPDREEATGTRWSVDHLFVDQDAVPTLVEVKRSTDTRIRREVVGQMLDYAANGVRYWPIDDLRMAYSVTQESLGNDPEEVIQELCEDLALTVGEFFDRVANNLRAGRIRMVFVADVVPDELRRITEFLNEQMTPAEVFAVEVKQYRAEDYPGTVIVPAVYGRTAASSAKSGAPRIKQDREAHLAASSPATQRLLELTSEFAGGQSLTLRETPSGTLLKTDSGGSVANVYLGPYNYLEVPLEPLRERGWLEEADAFYRTLQGVTSKALTRKNPGVPSEDVVARWETVRAVLEEMSALYRAR
jgi:hypothetical protein